MNRFRLEPVASVAVLLAATALAVACGASPNPSVPADPAGFTATPLSPTAAGLQWSASDGATGYTLERKTGAESYHQIYGGADLSFTDSGLTAGATYSYRLRASAPSGTSAGLERSVVLPPALAPLSPEGAARAIVQGTDPAAVVLAAEQSLAAGGVPIADGAASILGAQPPSASWSVDPAIAFNLAAEAHDRSVAGRFTVAQLAQMWSDVGFPFAGQGTTGEQLMGFLRAWVAGADANPAAPGSFTPLFIAAMAALQVPAVDLRAPLAGPDDLRLSLLEIEMLVAAFDRSVQFVAGHASSSSLRGRAEASSGACDQLKEVFGKLGEKGLGMGIDYVQGQLTDAALRNIGMSETDIATFSSTMKGVFAALGTMMKIAKLIQIYASAHAVMSVDGPNPVHQPPHGGARVLDPVTAHLGVPDQTWRDYQQGSNSQTAQNVKSCLALLGMPLPSELSDMNKDLDKWVVAWRLLSGSPDHATIPNDVNTFDSPTASDPFGMKVQRDGEASAKATLKVEIPEESPLADLFGGPDQTADVTVRAQVFTAGMPSPALVTKLLSFVGTLAALLDVSADWFKTAAPPTSTIPLHVLYRPLPPQLDASMSMSMHFLFGTAQSGIDFHMAADWSATLVYQKQERFNLPPVEFYVAKGTAHYTQVTGTPVPAEPDCTFSWVPHGGTLQGSVTPLGTAESYKFVFGSDAATRPSEELTIKCPNHDPVGPEPSNDILLAIQSHYDLYLATPTDVPGMPLKDWTKQSDGSLQRSFSGARVFTLAGNASLSVKEETTLFKLKPSVPAQ